MERNQDLLKRGSVLVDERDHGVKPRVLFYLEHAIQTPRLPARGERRVAPKRMRSTLELDGEGQARHVQYAPYLDYRPLRATEPTLEAIPPLGSATGSAGNWSTRLRPCHCPGGAGASGRSPCQPPGPERQTEAAVKDRLTKEIMYWDHRAEQLKLQEQAGKPNARLKARGPQTGRQPPVAAAETVGGTAA